MAKRILIVDDTQFMRKMLADSLVQNGYAVAGEAGNGREAIRLYTELRPDLVVMDINMPEMGGIEAIREVLKQDPEAAIVVCSAANQQDSIHEAMRVGAKGYILKPFKMTRVLEIIGKFAVSRAEPENVERPDRDKEPESVTGQSPEQTHTVAEVETREAAEEALETAGRDHGEASRETAGAGDGQQKEATADPLDAGNVRKHGATAETSETAVAAVAVETSEMGVAVETAEMIEAGKNEAKDELAALPEEVPSERYASPGNQSVTPIEKEKLSAASPEERLPREDAPARKERTGTVAPFRRRDSVHSFVSSVMCHWQEDHEGETASFTVVCTESENKVLVEMSGAGHEKQTMQFSLEGLLQLGGWLEEQVARTSAARVRG